MVVKEHLDAGPYMEGSRCVVDKFTELQDPGIYACLLYYRTDDSTGGR